jgi:hypothetical protein
MTEFKPRCIELGQQMFPDTTQITIYGADVCYFQWEPFERFVRENHQCLYEKDNRPYRTFRRYDWNIGFFVDSTHYGMFRMSALGYSEIASFVEAYKSLSPNESANSHFVTRTSGVIGKYSEEGIRGRIDARSDLNEEGRKEALEYWIKNDLGGNILGDSLVFHVPKPSNKENAKSLAEKVVKARMQMDYKKIRDEDNRIKEEYLIEGIS